MSGDVRRCPLIVTLLDIEILCHVDVIIFFNLYYYPLFISRDVGKKSACVYGGIIYLVY